MELNERVVARIQSVNQYLNEMRAERIGWGPEAEAEVAETALSFVKALDTLLSANEVWIDGGTGYSFGGNMSGIYFGMIAHRGVSKFEHCTNPPLDWSFHS